MHCVMFILEECFHSKIYGRQNLSIDYFLCLHFFAIIYILDI